MATYKKRGSKKAKELRQDEHDMAEEVFSKLDETASKSEHWVAKNQNYLLTGIVVVSLGALLYFGYRNLILLPQEREAFIELDAPQSKFFEAQTNPVMRDSIYSTAISGDGVQFGLENIIENYSGTKAANLAHFQAGVSYYKIGKLDLAIDNLEGFESDDEVLNAIAVGLIGDCFAQLEQNEDALSYYEKSIKTVDNGFVTPIYLFKAGIVAKEVGEYAKAAKFFNRIKDDYKDSNEAEKIDFYLQQIKHTKE